MRMCQGLCVMQETGVTLAQYMYRTKQTQKDFQFIFFHGTSYTFRFN